MKIFGYWRSILILAAVIVIIFVFVSLLDLGMSVLYSRYYSSSAFIVSFGVGGIFAAVFGYFYGIRMAPERNNRARWVMIGLILAIGIYSFFFLSKIEGGEYEGAIKAYGATLALGSLLFAFGKLEI